MNRSAGQITVRKIPKRLDSALWEKASRKGVSINLAAIEVMERGLGLGDEPVRHHDLDFLAGTLVKDTAFDQALAEQRRIDPEMWK